eukprot:Skav232622  [mRNA]  locus=scaffold12:37000:42257:+ [translate_table: standard]
MDKGPLERVRQYLQWRCRMKHFAGVACAKERAIAPGPRLDRHPDDEEVQAYNEMAHRKLGGLHPST